MPMAAKSRSSPACRLPHSSSLADAGMSSARNARMSKLWAAGKPSCTIRKREPIMRPPTHVPTGPPYRNRSCPRSSSGRGSVTHTYRAATARERYSRPATIGGCIYEKVYLVLCRYVFDEQITSLAAQAFARHRTVCRKVDIGACRGIELRPLREGTAVGVAGFCEVRPVLLHLIGDGFVDGIILRRIGGPPGNRQRSEYVSEFASVRGANRFPP